MESRHSRPSEFPKPSRSRSPTTTARLSLGLAIEFAQASAWTIQNVRPNGEPLGQKTYRLGSIAPGETVQAEAVLIPHTAGNWTLTMNLYGDARSDGIKLDYAGTFDFEVAVSP